MGFFGGGNDETTTNTSTTHNVTDARVGVGDGGVLLENADLRLTETTTVSSDDDVTNTITDNSVINYTSEGALDVAERGLLRGADLAETALANGNAAAAATLSAIGNAYEGAGERLERLTGASISNSAELARATIDQSHGFLDRLLDDRRQSAADEQDFALAAVDRAATAARSGTDETQQQTAKMIGMIGAAGVIAIALGAFK